MKKKTIKPTKQNELTMIINQNFKKTIQIPKQVKKIRISNSKSMNGYQIVIYKDQILEDYE